MYMSCVIMVQGQERRAYMCVQVYGGDWKLRKRWLPLPAAAQLESLHMPCQDGHKAEQMTSASSHHMSWKCHLP